MNKSEQAEGGKGRGVRFSDEELRDAIVEAIIEQGYRSAGAWNKARRAEGQGSNDQRVRKAWEAALTKSAHPRRLVEEQEAQRKAERADAFKAARATKATGTRKASARGRRTATREGHSEAAAEVVAKVDAQKRVASRRARKAAA